MKAWLKRSWKVLLLGLVAFLLADGFKSYYLASKSVSRFKTATNVRLSWMFFTGVWHVTFKMDAWHSGATVTYTVAPLLPVVMRERSCK